MGSRFVSPKLARAFKLTPTSELCACLVSRLDSTLDARRLDIGGKLLTNLLKETLSFRQWDMMDETWLTNALKEACCFVAAEPGKGPVLANVNAGNGRNGGGNGQKGKITNPPGRPSEWSFAQLLEMSQYVLASRSVFGERAVILFAGLYSCSRFGLVWFNFLL